MFQNSILFFFLLIYPQLLQESIPVGSVLPSSVATTRCQHQGVYLPDIPTTLPWYTPLPKEGTWDQEYSPPKKGPGIHTPL